MGIRDNPRTRRALLEDVLKGSLSVGALAALAGCDTPGEDPDISPDEDTTRIRRSIASLQASDPHNIIRTFKEAINQMKSLPSSDPRNWQNQVAIHGTTASFTECEHWNWLFLPWHRLYLTYFEEICREVTGNQHFALPFWNWARNQQLPDIFGPNHGTVTGPGGNNPLYNSTRRPSVGDSITSGSGGARFPSTWGPSVLESQVLSDPNFFRAVGGGSGPTTGSGTSQLEGYHDTIHVWGGGDMGSGNSPNDPLFWTHHCFVDCVWWEWNARRGHPNPNASDWVDAITVGGTDPAFETAPNLPSSLSRSEDFVDSQQNSITGGAATSFATLLMPLFTFHYENVGKGSAEAPTDADVVPTDTPTDELERHLEEGADIELEIVERFPVSEELRVPIEEPIELSTQVRVEDIRPLFSGEEPGQLLVQLAGINPPERIDVSTLVFVNRPDIFEEPTPDDPGFVGNVLFFGAHEHMDSMYKPLNVTEPLRRLDERQQLDDEQPVTFQLLSVPVNIGDVEQQEGERGYTIRSIDLAFTRSIIDGQVVEK